jgi:hypothetical protein
LFKYPVIERNMQGMDACELQYDIDGRQPWRLYSTIYDNAHYKKLFNPWRILRDVFRKRHECALQPKTLRRFL